MTARPKGSAARPPYDMGVVTGLRFAGNWGLRRDLKDRLDEAARAYERHDFQVILVSGKWSVWHDWAGVKPPVTEAARMRQYLVRKESLRMRF